MKNLQAPATDEPRVLFLNLLTDLCGMEYESATAR